MDLSHILNTKIVGEEGEEGETYLNMRRIEAVLTHPDKIEIVFKEGAVIYLDGKDADEFMKIFKSHKY